MNELSLAGNWHAMFPDGTAQDLILPGTLDTNQIGHADEANLEHRFTRLHTYEGLVSFKKKVDVSALKKKNGRIFLEIERARALQLNLGEHRIPAIVRGTMSTPYIFELTNHLEEDVAEIELLSDNSYPLWPKVAIKHSSAATDETQTNWNGLLGELKLRVEKPTFIQAISVYPHQFTADVHVEMNTNVDYKGEISLTCQAFREDASIFIELSRHQTRTFVLKDITLHDDIALWDEEVGNLYTLIANAEGCLAKEVTFGIRQIGINDQYRLTLNERVFFLRGESNCAVFPETGHPPMTKSAWLEVLQAYAAYGVNCMRFHSWCPPKAAFEAADEMGMMMQPELSCWNVSTAFESDVDRDFYQLELVQILHYFANHPSFVMFTFGNEPWNEEVGRQQMNKMLDLCREIDPTRLYANSSNPYYGQRGVDPKSHFYTSSHFYPTTYKEEDALHLRAYSSEAKGHLNEMYPNAKTDYTKTVALIHAQYPQAVFGFEVGQSQILPDFKEIDDFKGVTRAFNYQIIKENVEKNGMLKNWEKWVDATGEIAFLAYREEVEAALRTENFSGLSLLGLQDFPGQGTAIVGLLNSHLQPKPYPFAAPERFKKVFNSTVLLLYLEKYTYTNKEKLVAEIKLANYSKWVITGSVDWKLLQDGQVIQQGKMNENTYKNQGLEHVGHLEIDFEFVSISSRFDIQIRIDEIENTYPIWVYPEFPELEVNLEFKQIRIASHLDEETVQFLENGGCVYLESQPLKEKMPHSIGGQFTTDFWSVKTFPNQQGGMGMVIDIDHPALEGFPTDPHTNWQWWPMTKGRPMILPNHLKSILTVPDSYCLLKHMGLLVEARVGAGRIMISGMGLRFKQEYPEVKALLNSILTYMNTDQFTPNQEITCQEISQLVCE